MWLVVVTALKGLAKDAVEDTVCETVFRLCLQPHVSNFILFYLLKEKQQLTCPCCMWPTEQLKWFNKSRKKIYYSAFFLSLNKIKFC